jgi:hypothetical protein
MPSNLLKIADGIPVGILFLAMQSCASTINQSSIPISPSRVSPSLNNSTQIPSVNLAPLVETPKCEEQTIPLKIAAIRPFQVMPGSEITIIGTGGYVQDSYHGFNESARTFQLYLDNKSVGELLCYVNHCEAKIILADTIASGLHCLSTQKDFCEFEFQVAP